MPGPLFKDCEYSAFISYAHDDDYAWNWWVTSFARELNMTLPTRLRGIKPPKVHLSAKNGPIAGDLDDELRDRIAASFVMILVVHDNYAASGWCQRELEFFKSLFGDEGFRERLYILALSKTAIDDVMATPDWKRLTPTANLVWMPFYQDEDPDMPIQVYSDKGIVANAFWNPFVRLREDLAWKIRKSVEAQGAQPAYPPSAWGAPTVAPAARADDDTVRIYIESNQGEAVHWESVAAQVKGGWDRVVAGMQLAPPLYVRPSGLPMDQPNFDPRLDDADGVVLLWGRKTSDSLLAQITKVERKLPAPDPAPGVVAYLMPPQTEARPTPTAWGWKVLRFAVLLEAAVEVLEADAPALEAFLRDVLRRKKTRGYAPRASALVTP